MRFSSTAGLVAFAASTVANTISSDADLDGSVWENLKPSKARSFMEVPRNRPVKRASGWNPPSDMSGALQEVWDHCEETYNNGDLYGFKNYGWDQIMATEGTINMCVRWESTTSVTAAQRTKIASVLQTQYDKWFKWAYGYDNFPYSSIKVNVVGWAVSDTSLLEGDTSDTNVYTDTDSDGIPQCAEACGRYFHQDGDYSGCEAGADNHYDQSLWLTDGLSGGTGGDWGQRIGQEYFMELLDAENVHILLHEMGHTFGLDDFYDWTPTGQDAFIMLAGSATEVTDFDGWMYRNWWYELSRKRGWQTSTSSGTDSASSSSPSTTSVTSAHATSEGVEPAVTSSAAIETPIFEVVESSTTGPVAVETPVLEDEEEDDCDDTTTPVAEATTAPTSDGSTVGKWQQCGGANWTGVTRCESGLTCTEQNTYYFQCL